MLPYSESDCRKKKKKKKDWDGVLIYVRLLWKRKAYSDETSQISLPLSSYLEKRKRKRKQQDEILLRNPRASSSDWNGVVWNEKEKISLREFWGGNGGKACGKSRSQAITKTKTLSREKVCESQLLYFNSPL
jgi:hypothetical protein